MAAPRPLNKYVGILLVCLLIVGLLVFAGSNSDTEQNLVSGGSWSEALVGERADPKGGVRIITTEDIVNGQYYGRGGNATWRDGGLLSWMSRQSGDLIMYNTSNGNKQVVIKSGQFITRPWKSHFSKNLESVLVSFSPQRVFRSTILARYAVHDGKTGALIRELRTDNHNPNEPQAFQIGVWSNDNQTVMVVYKNDLYAIKARENIVTRLTSDGSDSIFNGIADWVFEEEIFVSTSTCVYSSTTGMYVAYLKFNDSVIEPITYNLYGDYSGEPFFDEFYQYPKFGSVRYPKSGRRNPTVSIHIVKIGDPNCWTSLPPTNECAWDIPLNQLMMMLTRIPDNFIIGQFQWLDNNEHVFSMLTFNRIQNKSWILECSMISRNCKIVRSNSQENGWIDNAPLFYHNNQYISLSSVPQSDKNEYMHVTGFTKDMARLYTRGHFSVDEIISIKRIGNKDVLIFKAPLLKISEDMLVKTEDVTQSHYYAIPLEMNSVPVCLTCYGDCTYNAAKFKNLEFVNTCERQHGVSNIHLVEILDNLSVNVKLKLEENRGLDNIISSVSLPQVDYFTIPYGLNGKIYSLSVKTTGPRGWMNDPARKYPVVVDTYSGPNSQKVTRRFAPNDWSYSLSSNPNNPVVYITIDGIGSGRQSSSLAFEVYRNLGDKEIHDKIYAMKHLLQKFRSLDPDRTLIWGWSYGGYVSAMTMGKDTEGVFKCGISVAPVVNWYYYDTMYTERYMSTPQDNPEAYNSSNVLRYTNNFAKKKFMLVHGNADDNVHYQQSMVLARALEQKAILFRMMSYPDENHSLGGVRLHLFRTLEEFVYNQCFRK